MSSMRIITLMALVILVASLGYSAAKRKTTKTTTSRAKAADVAKSDAAAPAAEPVKAASTPPPAPTPAAAATTSTTAAVSEDAIAPYIGKKFTEGAKSVKKIALTFDDGPSAKLTPQYLAVLKQENVPATFFMLGESVRKFPTMARQVAEAGFEIGCHTTKHQSLKRKSMAEIREEVIGTSDYIEKVTGKRPRLFRPPYGEFNTNVLKVCADGHMVLVNWSVDTNDWRPRTTPESVHATIIKAAHSGVVILMHDVHEKSVKVLASVIEELKAKGYEFVTVSELIAEAVKHKSDAPAMAADAGGAGAGEISTGPAVTRAVSIPLSKSGLE